MAENVEKVESDEHAVLEGNQMTSKDIEKQEEAKLKAKYPQATGNLTGHSAFLQKKLAKGAKYFDSGDYQMARQTLPNVNSKSRIVPSITSALLRTGEAIPTPESVPARKTSIIQPRFHSNTVPSSIPNQQPPPSN